MKICPKCKESIGDELAVCPFCKYQFSKEEIERVKKERQEAEDSAARHIEEKRAKRAKMRVIFSVVMMCFYIIPFPIGGALVSLTGNLNFIIGFAIAGMIAGTAVMLAGIIGGAFRCPYCESILFKNYGKHCVNCGKQLYY